MITRVLSLVRGADAGSARLHDPALDINAYAVAEDVELTLVLKDRGVELALAATRSQAEDVAGIDVPVADPRQDLVGLIGSGVRVHAVVEDLDRRGIGADALVEGIEPISEAALATMIADHDVTLGATS